MVDGMAYALVLQVGQILLFVTERRLQLRQWGEKTFSRSAIIFLSKLLIPDYLQDLEVEPPKLSNSGKLFDYLIWCPSPRIGANAPSLADVMKGLPLVPAPVLKPVKCKATRGQTRATGKKLKKSSAVSSSAVQVLSTYTCKSIFLSVLVLIETDL